MLIENTDKGSVITWDFDVMKHDVMFCVFRTVEAVKRKGGSTSGVAKEKKEELGSFNNMGTSGDPEHYTGIRLFSEIAMSIFEIRNRPRLDRGEGVFPRRGSDCLPRWRKHSGFPCHSVGKSGCSSCSVELYLVFKQVGTYILQWSYFDRVSLSGQSPDMWDNLTHPQHKAKLMFYYEVLNSLDYMGSMTSLQSTQSGFSSISKASGHHSTSGVSSGVSSNLSEAATARLQAEALQVNLSS